jgi:hypothetical protein
MLSKIRSLLDMPSESLRAEWQAKRQQMLHEMIDPTEFFINHIEHNEALS